MVKLCTVLLAEGMSPDGERIVSEETVVSPTIRQHEGLLDETFGIDPVTGACRVTDSPPGRPTEVGLPGRALPRDF